MRPPFTTAQFLDVFSRYNDAIFPAQAVLLILGLVAVGSALSGSRSGARTTFAILALLWMWMAIAFHLAFFTTLGTVGYLFAVAFALQGLLFLRLAAAPRPPQLGARSDRRGTAAAILLVYAIVGYPMVAVAVGHRFPVLPTFGVPCPTTIFTVGLLLLVTEPVPRSTLIVPAAWTLVAGSGALAFGMWEDIGVVVAGVAVTLLVDGAARRSAASTSADVVAARVSRSAGSKVARMAVVVVVTVVSAYLAYVGAAWLRYGRPPLATVSTATTLDRYIPVYEVRERHETLVAAPAPTTFATACSFDLNDSPVVRAIFGARELVMLRRRPRTSERQPFLHSIQAMGWGMLSASADRELVFGAVTKPWEGHVTFRALPATEFAAFHEPGYAKIVWSIAVTPVGQTTSRVSTETRVATTDPDSRARFRRYWSFASPGILLIRREALALLRHDAEWARMAAGSGATACAASRVARARP